MNTFTTRLLFVSALAIGVASAASSYKLTIYEPVSAGGTQLAAGQYEVEVQADKAIFRKGKKTFEVPATVEKTEQKFSATSYKAVDAKIKEIDLAGTSEKLIFTAPAASSGTK